MPDLGKHQRDSSDSSESATERPIKKRRDFASRDGVEPRIISDDLKKHAKVLCEEILKLNDETAQKADNLIRKINSPNKLLERRGISQWQELPEGDATRQRIEDTYCKIVAPQQTFTQTPETDPPQERIAIASSSTDQYIATTSEVPILQSSTDQQDAHDPAMLRFLDKTTLENKITKGSLDRVKKTFDKSSGIVRPIYKHRYENTKVLREYIVYNNTTQDDAIKAYKEIEGWYTKGKYNDVVNAWLKKLGFPFAQD